MEEARQMVTELEHGVGLVECAWHDIEQPGAYVDLDTGDLYRIPKEALLQGASPLIRRESSRAGRLVRISKNPFVTTLVARLTCCEHNITPNF